MVKCNQGDEVMPKFVLLENKNLNDFNPLDFGTQTCPPDHSFGPAVRQYFLIHYVIAGCGIFEQGGVVHNIQKGQAFLIKKGETTFYKADSKNPWKYMWIGFDGNMSHKFNSLPPVLDINGRVFFEMLEVSSMQYAKEEFLAGKLFMLYAQLFGKSAKNDYANSVLNYINQNYMKNIRISAIASSIGIDRRYLAGVFKKRFGISMQEYLHEKRMSEAKHLLLSGYNVSEACFLSGHNDPSNFSKAFKKRFGITPKDFAETSNSEFN